MKISLSKTIIGVAVSSMAIGVIGCQTLTNPKKSQPITDSVTAITAKNENGTLPPSNLSASPQLYYFSPTLSMQTIYPVVTGRYIIEDNCLKFEQIYNDKTRQFTPIFNPTYKVSLLQDEQAIVLDGVKVDFGETIKTGGKIKDEYLFYNLQFYNPQNGVYQSVKNPNSHSCLQQPGIFMRSKLID